jgi:MYXO-CTERM domain-containing protein
MRSLLVVAGLGGVASAAPMSVTGDVIATHSRWVSDRSRIVTDATVRTPDGDVVVTQLGGSVDGLGMRAFPGPEMLATGMRVTLAAHEGRDLARRAHVMVDDVKVDAYPPGFVRTGPTKAGHSLYWESGCIFLTVDAAGTKEIPGDQEFPIVDASIATWNDGTASCSYMQIVDQGRQDVETSGADQVNVLVFRDASWCRPAVGNDAPECHPESAAGITTATYIDDGTSPRDGAIVDADIEINGVNFAISAEGQTLGDAPCLAELQNTLTHELGHLHGLEHTCTSPGDPGPDEPPRIDDQGGLVPACSATTDPAIVEATMYPYQDCGETKKETLEADDVAAVCAIYPTAQDPGTCAPVGIGGGCCSADPHPGGPLLLALAVGLGALRRKRRTRE